MAFDVTNESSSGPAHELAKVNLVCLRYAFKFIGLGRVEPNASLVA